MSKLNYQRLAAQQRATFDNRAPETKTGSPPRNRRMKGARKAKRMQPAYDRFVAKHRLSCFKCKTGSGPWGKVGTSTVGPWAICESCRQEANAQT